jgi:transcription-repair coupling factor (superfamily II helicase)
VLTDMNSGKPMDRLVCGDVGFGKTEVALRAAFVAAMSGKQIAVVTPTTLLCRQHFKTFTERFHGFPVTVRQMSRLVTNKDMAETKDALKAGRVDIVIGTHALLSKSIEFSNLGLLIVDEEQHFGVVQKERLKELRGDVHVLTLTATPIPRTLQLALSGIREMSLITTPPVDRLAVQHLRAALRPGDRARSDHARAFPRRADLLRLPAHRGHGCTGGAAAEPGAGDQVHLRPWPHVADRLGKGDDRLL